jgi:hypothetical protein
MRGHKLAAKDWVRGLWVIGERLGDVRFETITNITQRTNVANTCLLQHLYRWSDEVERTRLPSQSPSNNALSMNLFPAFITFGGSFDDDIESV